MQVQQPDEGGADDPFKALFDMMLDPALVVGPTLRVHRLNKAAMAFFGTSPQSLLGAPADHVIAMDHRELCRAKLRHVLASGEPEVDWPQVLVTRADGRLSPARMGMSVTQVDGQPMALMVLRDMDGATLSSTQLKDLRARADSAQLKLQQATMARDAFLAAMSHELRTPLNSIIGFSEVLEDADADRDTWDTVRDYAGYINRSGRQLLAMLNDILDYTGLRAGQRALEVGPLPLGGLADLVPSRLRDRASRKRVGLTLEHCDPPLTLLADAEALSQLVGNLIDNAIKFTDPGGAICVAATQAGDRVTLTISDTGCGMSAQHLARLGEPFFHAGQQGHADVLDGTGLGVAVARLLALRMGGGLSFLSTPGAGTTATVTLLAVPAGRPHRAAAE